MNNEHTPGPWQWVDPITDIPGYSHRCTSLRTVKHGRSFCDKPDQLPDWILDTEEFEGTPKEAEANARLIAAAPELLEACKAILTLDELEMGDDSLLPPEHPKAMVYAAIAKATGGTQ
jgi:hypothetical protein